MLGTVGCASDSPFPASNLDENGRPWQQLVTSGWWLRLPVQCAACDSPSSELPTPCGAVLVLLLLWNAGTICTIVSACCEGVLAACRRPPSAGVQQPAVVAQEATQDIETGAVEQKSSISKHTAAVPPTEIQGNSGEHAGQGDSSQLVDASRQSNEGQRTEQVQHDGCSPHVGQAQQLRVAKWAVIATGYWVASLNAACVMVAGGTSQLRCGLPWPYLLAFSLIALSLFLALTYPWGFHRWQTICEEWARDGPPPGASQEGLGLEAAGAAASMAATRLHAARWACHLCTTQSPAPTMSNKQRSGTALLIRCGTGALHSCALKPSRQLPARPAGVSLPLIVWPQAFAISAGELTVVQQLPMCLHMLGSVCGSDASHWTAAL